MKRLSHQFAHTPDETIDLLESNTTGDPLQIVSRLRIAAGFEPRLAELKLWTELQRQYGSPSNIARALQQKLDNLPQIGGDMSKLKHFHDECEIVRLHMDHIDDYQGTPEGTPQGSPGASATANHVYQLSIVLYMFKLWSCATSVYTKLQLLCFTSACSP